MTKNVKCKKHVACVWCGCLVIKSNRMKYNYSNNIIIHSSETIIFGGLVYQNIETELLRKLPRSNLLNMPLYYMEYFNAFINTFYVALMYSFCVT